MATTQNTSKGDGGGEKATVASKALESLVPGSVPGYERRALTSVYHHDLKTPEAIGSYEGEAGKSLLIAIADLGAQPRMYKNFLTGGGLRQSSVGNSFGLSFRQASLQGSANYGLLLNQGSPAFSGQPSGVVGMAQTTQPIQFSVASQASPQASPQESPQESPQFSPQISPQASPQFSPQASPQASPQFSPQASPQASPQFSPQASPQTSPQFSPQNSPQFSPQASPQFSPQNSPQFSPQASPQFSPQQSSPQFSPQASPQFSPQQASPQFSAQVSPQFSPEQASPQFSPQFSPQASPQFSPQASPQFSPQQSSPQFSPQASPQFSPQASPQFSPQQSSPQFSPQASPQFSPQASPQFSPQQSSPQFSPQQASPQFSPQVSPQASPQQASPQFSPQASPQFSPQQASPQFSPQASPQASTVVFSQASPARAKGRWGVSLAQSSLTPTQVSAQLQRSGVDLRQLSGIAQESPFSLSQSSSSVDGSYVRPFGLDTGYDVAGWELYDASTRTAVLLLGLNDRLGILIEGANVGDPNTLLEIANKLDYKEAEKLISDAA